MAVREAINMGYLETSSAVLDPADDEIRIFNPVIIGDSEHDIAEGSHLHFKGHFLVIN